jgi:hypothetical protein
MTFDPTPAIAPPRAQAAGIEAQAGEDPVEEEEETGTASAERGTDPAGIDGGTAAEGSGGGGTPAIAYIGLGLLGAALLGAAGLYLVTHRRHGAMTIDDHVAELERALRRSGRVSSTGLTLASLERRCRTAPDAVAYVRTLRDGRYGFGARTPTRRQRSALRRELAAGLGLRGRLRALWAFPPW